MAGSPTFQRTSLILEPPLAAEALVKVGFTKSHLPPWKMAILGFLAGIYVCFGGQAMYSVLTAGGTDEAAATYSTSYGPLSGTMKFFGGIVFSTALILIVIAGAELFTGNCLILMAVLAKRVTLSEMLFDWLMIYFSNFLGVIFMSAIIYGGGGNGYYSSVSILDVDNYNETLTRTGKLACYFAKTKAHLGAWEIFFRAIPANMLVCLAVIMATAGKSAVGKVSVILLPIGSFVVSGFEHSIANMYVFTMATMLNCDSSSHGLYWLNLLLSTLGNIIGASILAVCYYFSFIMPSESVGVGINHKELLVPEEHREVLDFSQCQPEEISSTEKNRQQPQLPTNTGSGGASSEPLTEGASPVTTNPAH